MFCFISKHFLNKINKLFIFLKEIRTLLTFSKTIKVTLCYVVETAINPVTCLEI